MKRTTLIFAFMLMLVTSNIILAQTLNYIPKYNSSGELINSSMSQNTDNTININTGNGYVNIGPANADWCHINTDRTKFYFGKPIYVWSGIISSYNTDNLKLSTNGTERITVLNANGNVGIGSTNPTNKLFIQGASQSDQQVAIGSSTTPRLFLGDAANLNGVVSAYHGMTFIMDVDNNAENTFFAFGRDANSSAYTELFRISNTGNVGIGTSNPVDKLEVNGNLSVTGNGSTGNSGINGGKTTGVFTLNGNTWSGDGPTIEMYGKTQAGSPGQIRQISYGTGNILFSNYDGANWYDRMVIKANGNVGIATTSPLEKLEVDGNIKSKYYSDAMFSVLKPNDLQFSKDEGNAYISNIGTNGNLAFTTNGGSANIRMFISATGNVGIGTTNPGTFKLAVEGKVGAREFVATLSTPWPDFVFSKEYTLMPLSELENFVNETNHLPNIPSSKEISDNGVSLGEMNSMLLQKIEELTLYIIDQNKKIEALQNEVDVLKNE